KIALIDQTNIYRHHLHLLYLGYQAASQIQA
ncbi:MAG: hypothetical protein ACI8YD_003351, partial [Rheinheimera aquimaris]